MSNSLANKYKQKLNNWAITHFHSVDESISDSELIGAIKRGLEIMEEFSEDLGSEIPRKEELLNDIFSLSSSIEDVIDTNQSLSRRERLNGKRFDKILESFKEFIGAERTYVNGQIENLPNAIIEWKTRLNKLKEDEVKYQSEISNLEKEENEINDNIKTLKDRVNRLNLSLDLLKEEKEEIVSSEKFRLQKIIETVDDLTKLLEQDLSNNRLAFTKLEKDIENKGVELKNLIEDYRNLENKNKLLLAKLEKYKAQHKEEKSSFQYWIEADKKIANILADRKIIPPGSEIIEKLNQLEAQEKQMKNQLESLGKQIQTFLDHFEKSLPDIFGLLKSQ